MDERCKYVSKQQKAYKTPLAFLQAFHPFIFFNLNSIGFSVLNGILSPRFVTTFNLRVPNSISSISFADRKLAMMVDPSGTLASHTDFTIGISSALIYDGVETPNAYTIEVAR